MKDSLTAPVPFPGQTAWSIVLTAAARTSPDWKERFEKLVGLYWKPVFWYLVRHGSCSREDARDLTQEFFLRLYEKDFLGGASPERGRFRTFLKLQLRNLMVDDLRRRTALKRGGGAPALPIGGDAGTEPAWEGLTPDEEFDRVWAAETLSEALRELEATLKAGGKETWYRAFYDCCVSHPPQSYKRCAETLGIGEANVRNFVHRSRLQLKEILVRRVRETLEDDGETEDELGAVLRPLGL